MERAKTACLRQVLVLYRSTFTENASFTTGFWLLEAASKTVWLYRTVNIVYKIAYTPISDIFG